MLRGAIAEAALTHALGKRDSIAPYRNVSHLRRVAGGAPSVAPALDDIYLNNLFGAVA
jgi:hypothetical protein